MTHLIRILPVIFIMFIACNRPHPVDRWVREDLAKPAPTSEIQPTGEQLPTHKLVCERGHSSITFRLGHWEILDIVGLFLDYDIVMYYDKPDYTDAIIEARIKTSSVFMPNEKMMQHIQGDQYFKSNVFPYMIFKSREMELVSENKYALHGSINVAGVAVEKTLDVTYNGLAYPDQMDNPISGWTVKGFVTQEELRWDNSSTLHSGRKTLNDSIFFTANLRMEKEAD